MATKYVIIGGGVCGTTAAETVRKNDPDGEVTIVSDEPYRLYSRIAISKGPFFTGKMPFDSVWLKKEDWYSANRVNLIKGKRAVKLDPAVKAVILDDGSTLRYDKLFLALGIKARAWTVPGTDKKGIWCVRTLDDFKGYIAAVKTAKRALVVGGGAIGFEMCEMFKLSGLEVALSIREPHYWDPVLDEPSGRIIERALERHGVKIYRGKYIKEAYGGENIEGVTLDDGTTKIPCDIAVASIGGYCPFDWLKDSGIKLNRGIVVNEFLETGLPDVWAGGDAAEYQDLIFNEATQFGSWSNAQWHGRAAGANMTGKRAPYRQVTFYAVSGLGLNISFVGTVAPLPDRKVISRYDASKDKHARLILKGGKLVGATLLNASGDIPAVTKLIDLGIDLSGKEANLADATFDLKSLLGA
jgi:NAD(P)H-nitrite reductase large subunit